MCLLHWQVDPLPLSHRGGLGKHNEYLGPFPTPLLFRREHITPETSVVVIWQWGWGKLGISRWWPPLQLHGLLGAGPGPLTGTPRPQGPLLHLILCVLSLVGLSVSLPCALGLSIPCRRLLPPVLMPRDPGLLDSWVLKPVRGFLVSSSQGLYWAGSLACSQRPCMH